MPFEYPLKTKRLGETEDCRSDETIAGETDTVDLLKNFNNLPSYPLPIFITRAIVSTNLVRERLSNPDANDFEPALPGLARVTNAASLEPLEYVIGSKGKGTGIMREVKREGQFQILTSYIVQNTTSKSFNARK